eukprot:PhF_6_TR22263/c0_g1_i2/m.31467
MSSSCVKISVPEHLYIGQTIYGMIYNPNGLSQNDYVAVYHQGKLISYSWMLSSQQPTFHIIIPPQWIPTIPRKELSVSLRYFVNGGMISKGTVMASLDVVLEIPPKLPQTRDTDSSSEKRCLSYNWIHHGPVDVPPLPSDLEQTYRNFPIIVRASEGDATKTVSFVHKNGPWEINFNVMTATFHKGGEDASGVSFAIQRVQHRQGTTMWACWVCSSEVSSWDICTRCGCGLCSSCANVEHGGLNGEVISYCFECQTITDYFCQRFDATPTFGVWEWQEGEEMPWIEFHGADALLLEAYMDPGQPLRTQRVVKNYDLPVIEMDTYEYDFTQLRQKNLKTGVTSTIRRTPVSKT